MTTLLSAGWPRFLFLAFVLFVAGCQPAGEKTAGGKSETSGRFKVGVQTDWVAQAEHGGFYQALADGTYARAGLDVDVIAGGPGTSLVPAVATDRIAFGITRSDEIIKAVVEDVPIVIICAYLQHDPQAILFHEENPIRGFKDLDNRTVMTTPGAYWIRHAEATYGIKLNILPMNYSLAPFLSDKKFIQQCFVTNEPFYARRAGAHPATILLLETGYDPYRVVFTSRRFARAHPEIVRAFVAATLAGWQEYIAGDPAPANTLIRERNPEMVQELLDYSREELRRQHLALGDPARGDANGLLRRRRLQEQVDTLVKMQILAEPMPLEKFARFEFLPAELQPLVEK